MTHETATELMMKKFHNQPALLEIVASLEAGLNAIKEGDNAQIKLTHGVFFAIKAASISLVKCVAGCGIDPNPEKEVTRKAEWTKLIDGLCSEYSVSFNEATATMIELKDASGDVKVAQFEAAKKTAKAVQAMFRRAVRTAAMLHTLKNKETGENIPVKVSIKGDLLRVLFLDKHGEMYDAASWTATDCVQQAAEFWPKTKREPKVEVKKDETVASQKKSLADSIAFVRTMITAHNWASQDKGIKDEIAALYAQLTPLFAAKDAPILIKVAKKA